MNTENAKIISQEMLVNGIYSMVVKCEAAQTAKAGQFVSLYSKDEAHLLPRPISISHIDKENSTLRLVYRVVGYGTDEFSSLKAGDEIKLMGPLGNGFPVSGKRPMVVGGGIGVPPMVGLAEALASLSGDDAPEAVMAVMGYRDDNLFLTEELTEVADLYIATDDGSVGTHGTVVDAIVSEELKPDIIYACGPKPMLRALAQYAKDNDITCYVSMEERMACGIGACLGCVCKSTEVDDHSKVHNKRICKDGPVFLSTEVEL